MFPIVQRAVAYVIALVLVLFILVYATILTALHAADPEGLPTVGQVWLAWLLAAWPALFALGVRVRSRFLTTVSYVLYIAQSLWLGLTVGVVHLVVGGPLFLVALIFAWRGARGGFLFSGGSPERARA